MRIETVGAAGTERASLSADEPAALKVGTIIDAVAQRDAGSGKLWLDTPYGRLPATLLSQDGTAPTNGEALKLRVIGTSPALELETISSNRTEPDEALASGLMRYLPQQSSPMPLLANLGWLARGAASGNGFNAGPNVGSANGAGDPLPPNVLAMASRLWNAIADSSTLADPKQLAAAIARSGLQLEANLAGAVPQDKASLQNDLKGLLLVFKQALDSALATTRPAVAMAGTDASALDATDAIVSEAFNGNTYSPPGMTSAAKPSDGMSGAGMPNVLNLPTRGAMGQDLSLNQSTPPPLTHATLTPLSKLPATLTLLDSLHDQLTELSQQTTGSLARLTVNQLSNASTNGTNSVWLMEIPVRHEDRPDLVRLKFERDRQARADGGESESWSVEVALNLGAAGPMHARVSYDGQRINVHMRADSAALMRSIQDNSYTLAQGLRDAGLQVGGITWRAGMPAADNGASTHALLDMHA